MALLSNRLRFMTRLEKGRFLCFVVSLYAVNRFGGPSTTCAQIFHRREDLSCQ